MPHPIPPRRRYARWLNRRWSEKVQSTWRLPFQRDRCLSNSASLLLHASSRFTWNNELAHLWSYKHQLLPYHKQWGNPKWAYRQLTSPKRRSYFIFHYWSFCNQFDCGSVSMMCSVLQSWLARQYFLLVLGLRTSILSALFSNRFLRHIFLFLKFIPKCIMGQLHCIKLKNIAVY